MPQPETGHAGEQSNPNSHGLTDPRVDDHCAITAAFDSNLS
jgi:hypothetical protein